MAKINLRLYGEQIYPNISNILTKFISPEIGKDEFISMYKNGNIELKEILLKESFSIQPQIKIENASISYTNINIPDEQENFGISLSNIKCLISISEIDENEIEKIIIEEKKKLIEEFINYSFKKVLKKDGASFLDNLIKSVVEKIINGLKIEINNLELRIKAKNRDNIYFVFIIDNINYSFDKGISIQNINLIYQEDDNKIDIIKKISVSVDIKNAQENGGKNQITMNISDAIIKMNKKIFLELLNIYDIFNESKYKKIFTKYKKLILFQKPKLLENNKKDYKSLWLYAIKTIIKLQKYVGFNKDYIFDLADFSQIKIIEKYLENNNLINNIILSENENILKATKKKVEKKVLDDKNSNVLANAFSFFFGAKKEEKKNELSEEEKQIMDEIYKEQNLIKYLNNDIDNKSNNFNIILEKFKTFLSNISVNFQFSNIELNINNNNQIHDVNFFIRSLNFNLNYSDKQFDFVFSIGDIGSKINNSFFKKINSLNAIVIIKDINNSFDLKFGFENIELKIDDFLGLFIFLNSIQRKKRQQIFHERINLYKENKQKEMKNEIVNKIRNFSFTNNCKLSNIPSLSILMKDNKIDLNIFNYSLTENSIQLSININDSFGKILNDLSLELIKKEKTLSLNLEAPIEINIQNETFSIIMHNYNEYVKEISKENDQIIIKKDILLQKNEQLFEFNYIKYKNIDFGSLNLKENTLNIAIKKFDLKIYNNKKILGNSFILNDLKLIYEKMNLNISFNSCIITTDFKSNIFLFNKDSIFENNNFPEEIESNIKTKIKYNNTFKNILNKFNINGKTINIIINYEQLLLAIDLKNITTFNEDDNQNLCLIMDNWNCNACLSKSKSKNNNIIKCDKRTEIKYDILLKFFRVKLDYIYSDIEIQIMNDIYNFFLFLTKKDNDNLIENNIDNYKFEFDINILQYNFVDNYIINMSQINIRNFNEKEKNFSNYYFILNKLNIDNINKLTILSSSELNIDFNPSSNHPNKMNIKFKEIYFNISQNDLSFLYTYFKLDQKNEYNKFYSADFINNDDKNKLLNLYDNDDKSKIEKDDEKLKSKNSIFILPKENNKNLLYINLLIEKIDLSFCKNDSYEKIALFSMKNLNINSAISLSKEINLSNDYNHKLFVQELELIYFYGENEQLILLKKKDKNSKENQIQIIYDNNNCEININSNEINLRIDSFLFLFYYVQGNKPLKKTYISINEAIEIKKYFKLSFFDSKFQLSTSFNGKENLFLDINNFTVIYNNKNYQFPYGNYSILLDKISSQIIHKNNTRKLFKTGDNFVIINLDYYEDLISSNISIGEVMINLSYRDFVSFLRAYQMNLRLISLTIKNKEEVISDINDDKETKVKKAQTPGFSNKETIRILAGELSLKKISLTLIDDSKGSYQPFLNFFFENNKITYNPDNTFNSKFSFRLTSYNYIACMWEPVIEKVPIILNGLFKDKYEFNCAINSFLINLSDMAISFTLITFNNWLAKFDIKKEKFENKEIKLNNNCNIKEEEKIKKLTKITNNQIINYTGIQLKIIHEEKELECPPLEKIELDNSNLDDFDGIKKPKKITLLYDQNNLFEIPLEKIISLMHKVNDNLFIISENSLSENKTINISFYSPIIFKNKTPFCFKICISNRKYGLSEIILESNSICGFPMNLIDSTTYFCFLLYENKILDEKNRTEDYSLDNILNTNKGYKKRLDFSNKSFTMNLTKKFGNLRILSIYSEYNIVNCLPFDIYIDYFNRGSTIEKCSQFYITDNYFDQLFISFSINTEFGRFSTERINLLDLDTKNSNNYLTFKYYAIGKKFKLPYIFKNGKEEKELLIYAELILYNKSGLNLSINYANSNKLICFTVKENINLISSDIDYKEETLQFRSHNYYSKKIKIHKLIQITNYMNIKMNDANEQNPYDIIIKKKPSYVIIKNNLNFKEKIISIVFTIFPMCRIFNLLSTKRFLLCDYENINRNNSLYVINPLGSANFQFFNKGRNALLGITALNLNVNNYKNLTKFKFRIGIYTLIADNFIYNLDIKQNPTGGFIDVYILENTINNSQTILENLSDEKITIFQKNYEQNKQNLNPKDIIPLRIYDFFNKDFIFQTSDSKDIINIDKIINWEKNLNNKTMILFQNNGIKMKITFYSMEKYNKSKSNLMYINYNIYINTIFISIIGDNEIQHPKLNKYDRYELLLIYMKNFSVDCKIQQTTGLLNKNLIKTKLSFDKIGIYNQLNSECKFTCVLKNDDTPCFYLENEINYYQKQKIINFVKQKINIKKLVLGIDPNFWRTFLNFYDNVLYRMDLTYLKVNKIFLHHFEIDPKRLINKHMKGRLLINAPDLVYPKLDIEFELVEKGLKDLLKERIACSDFYIWVVKGLVGSVQELSLENSIMSYKNGTIVQYFIWLYYEYERKIENNLSELGFKGIFGQFKNFLSFDLYNEDEKNKNIQKKKFREIRPFYGKFRYFQEYDENDAILIKNTFLKNKNFMMNKYYPTKIIKGKKTFYLFTNIAMFHIDSSQYNLMWNIDYFFVKNVTYSERKIKVIYNQKIDNYESCSFMCENKEIAKEMAETLIEETLKNKVHINEI